MKSFFFKRVVLVSLVSALASSAHAQLGSTVSNWTVPKSGPSSANGVRTTMTDYTSPVAFIGVTPCRIVDTRQANGPFGGPALTQGSPRSFAIPSGPCTGIPPSVEAYSLNVTVTNTQGPGFILIYPQGGTQPGVSTLNYVAGQTVANAAIVPAGTGGGVTVIAGVSGTNLIIDINGYYGHTPGDSQDVFEILNDSSLYSIFTVNSRTNCSGACGIYGQTDSTFDNSAVEGFATGATGINHGVAGYVNSSDSGASGVYGQTADGSPGVATSLSSGVYGASQNGYGVLGAARQAGYGVGGKSLDDTGTVQSAGYLGYDNTTAVYAMGNFTATGTKSFVEPHPVDPSRAIAYVALEGPESGTYFRGSSELHGGRATIEVPESFRLVTDTEGITVQVTPIGGYSQVYIESQDLNQIVVRGSRDVRFHYTVNGVRRSFKDYDPMVENVYFRPESAKSRMPGALAPEQKRILIQTGVYNEDGTVNMATAEKVGWTKLWAARAAQPRVSAAVKPKTAGIESTN